MYLKLTENLSLKAPKTNFHFWSFDRDKFLIVFKNSNITLQDLSMDVSHKRGLERVKNKMITLQGLSRDHKIGGSNHA